MGALAGLSAFFGFVFGLVFYFIFSGMGEADAFARSVIMGVGCTILLHIVLSIAMKRRDKKYAKLEKMIDLPIIAKTNGNIYPENGKLFNANIYFCDTGIVFLSVEQKINRIQMIEKSDITELVWSDMGLDIRTNNGSFFHILIPNAKTIYEELKEKGKSETE